MARCGNVSSLYHGQDSQLTQLVHNSSNSRPKWKLEGLSAGEQYTARLALACIKDFAKINFLFNINLSFSHSHNLVCINPINLFRIYASDVGGQSSPVMVKVSTHQESSRFLILPPEEGQRIKEPNTLGPNTLHFR